MLKMKQRKQKMIARAISASFLVQTCAFPAVHAFAANEAVTVTATPVSNANNTSNATPNTNAAVKAASNNEEKAVAPKINLKESASNSFKDKSDSELWAALGITRDEYDKVSMSEFKNYIEKRHANDEAYQNSRKEKKDSYDLVMTEAETEMLNRKNNSFSWQAENSANKVNGYFIEKKSDGGANQFKTGGSAVKHAFENWDTLSDAQKQTTLMTAVQMGYNGKVTSDNDKFKAVENLKSVINAYSKDRTLPNVYEAVTDFMKSNNIDFDKVLKDADNAQQQVNQTSDNNKTTNGVEEKNKPCPTGYKHDTVNNVCCADDSTFDKFEGKCKKEINAANACNAGYTLDSYANKCCPTGSSYDLAKGACVIKGEEKQESNGGGRNKQILGVLAGLMMNKKGGGSASDAKNSDSTGGAIARQEDRAGMTKERAESFMTVPFDFKFSYGDDNPASQRYFGEIDKDNNVVVAGSESRERINITIKDRGKVAEIENAIRRQIDNYNKKLKKNNRPLMNVSEYPKVHFSLRIFNPEAIEKGTINDTDRKWLAPYSLLKKMQEATNGMAEYEIEEGKPEVVVPEGFTRPAGDYFVHVIYHIPYFNEKSQKVTYRDTTFTVSYTVFKANTSLAADKLTGDSEEAARGVARVEKDYGQVEATGVINEAVWNDNEGTCDMKFSGRFADANQTTESNNVKVRSKSISQSDCKDSVGKQASFGKLTLSTDYSQQGGGKELVDFSYDGENNPQSLGGAVTIGEKVVQDGDYALDNEYEATVNRGKHISSARVDMQNLDYINVGGMNLAYNSVSKEFYNYDGTPLSSSQKKDIAKDLGTTYWDEWNHIGADVTVNDDGTVSLTRTDGSVVTGTRTDESLVEGLQKSTDAIRGGVLRELAEDRAVTTRHYTSADEYKSQNAGDYRYLFSNPQSKLQSDAIGIAASSLEIGDNSVEYLRRGLNTAFDISGSAAAKNDKEEKKRQREQARQERNEQRAQERTERNVAQTENVSTSSSAPSQNVNPPIEFTNRFDHLVTTQGITTPVADTPKDTLMGGLSS